MNLRRTKLHYVPYICKLQIVPILDNLFTGTLSSDRGVVMKYRVLLFLPVFLFAAACSGGGEGVLLPDVAEDAAAPELVSDTKTADTGPGLPEIVETDELLPEDAEPEFMPECRPGQGCFLDPCDDNSDCLYGPCVQHMGNKVCSRTCVEECPDGWLCEQLADTAPDLQYACVSPYTHLCLPCTSSNDCVSLSGVADVCVVYGNQGSFCGAECADEECPPGYSCVDSMTTEDVGVKQCMADAGICSCSDTAMKLGLFTPCSIENEFGMCEGVRVCGPDGLAACDAAVPALEECNGVDDDCDGEMDNDVCDDGNQCTNTSCDPDAGCVVEPLTGTGCDDGDVCSLADHCEDGECIGTAINCDDDNPCTADSCDPSGGCVYSFNSMTCDDGDPCTVGDVCIMGTCEGTQIPCDCKEDSDCLELEDGDICNGTLYCDTNAFPQVCTVDPKTIIVCEEPKGPGSECLEAACHPLSGECSFVAANDGFFCEDNNPCTVSSTCLEGECVGGVAMNCDDDNICTDDSCDPGLGCVHEGNQGLCEDGNLCTIGDTCVEGKCTAGWQVGCNDGNVCTDDSCDPVTGCVYEMNTAACNDGNACSTGDMCKDGACQGPGALPCNDGNSCTDDGCDAIAGCVFTNNTDPCSDGNPCTTDDSCKNGACQGQGALNCDDGNQCTNDGCSPVTGCVHINSNSPCSDGNVCTLDDACSGGSCQGGSELSCNDGNECTDDWCDPAKGCLHVDNVADCDDANECTSGEQCFEGVCGGGDLEDCGDGNICTTDSCDPADGCVHTLNSAPCDDDDVCTTKDVCMLGECLGSGELPCNDANPCTDDSCEPQIGCVFITNDSPCDDGNECTTGEACSGGWCVGISLVCNDDNLCTDDSCDPAIGCVSEHNEAPCDDENACTFNDKCQDGACQSFNLLDCDDGNACTDDSCDPATGCANENNSDPCTDNNVCTDADLCAGGTCVPGQALDCSDGNPCTTDSCHFQDGCTYVPVVGCCLNDGDCDDGDPNTVDTCQNNECKHIADAGLPHNSQKFSYDHHSSGGCGNYSTFYTKNFGQMNWKDCEAKANLHGAQFAGAPDLYGYNAPYKGFQRWVGEKNNTQAYTSTGSWNKANTRNKSEQHYCVLAYANGAGPGNNTFNSTKVVNGKTYHYHDYGNTGESACYSNCRQHGARPLNPQMFGVGGAAHMVENHSCHGSLQYSGGGISSNGSADHSYKCFIGYYSE